MKLGDRSDIRKVLYQLFNVRINVEVHLILTFYLGLRLLWSLDPGGPAFHTALSLAPTCKCFIELATAM